LHYLPQTSWKEKVMTPAMSRALDLWPAHDRSDRTLNAPRKSLVSDNWIEKVRIFNQLRGDRFPDEPTLLSTAEARLQIAMLDEELNEITAAIGLPIDEAEPNPIEALDGILDLIYVALGTALRLGFSQNQILCAMEEIHASNMTKFSDEGKPVLSPLGKITKGPNYIAPDLYSIL
jgi:predicted HAD superfamily Cof-like phosphohydrolase